MKVFHILFALLFSLSSIGQIFEGKMTLTNYYQSKIPNVTNEQLTAMFGSIQEYYVKDGTYKSVVNGTFVQWQLYVNADNKLYNKYSNSDTVNWNDGAINLDKVLKSEINKNVVKILGYDCDELILTCMSGVQKYYYNAAFGIDPALYSKHLFGNWFSYVSLAKALPLKIIFENAQFLAEMVVTEITPMKLDETFFKLPANAITKQAAN
ncbi:MAG: hypothetical protein V4717_06255 [Bacteroidota bacterium]